MELNDDVWVLIKQFLFYKHLWTFPENTNFSNTMKELLLINNNIHNLSYRPIIFVRNSNKAQKFIKTYNMLVWKNNYTLIVSFMLTQEDIYNDFLKYSPYLSYNQPILV
tara:strand:- start:1473 stop:1799 length:327 start_codon:yes stop_codon:yes gene_type:complete